jgi:hypothetical protein
MEVAGQQDHDETPRVKAWYWTFQVGHAIGRANMLISGLRQKMAIRRNAAIPSPRAGKRSVTVNSSKGRSLALPHHVRPGDKFELRSPSAVISSGLLRSAARFVVAGGSKHPFHSAMLRHRAAAKSRTRLYCLFMWTGETSSIARSWIG